jgi:hypothetical protein
VVSHNSDLLVMNNAAGDIPAGVEKPSVLLRRSL